MKPIGQATYGLHVTVDDRQVPVQPGSATFVGEGAEWLTESSTLHVPRGVMAHGELIVSGAIDVCIDLAPEAEANITLHLHDDAMNKRVVHLARGAVLTLRCIASPEHFVRSFGEVHLEAQARYKEDGVFALAAEATIDVFTSVYHEGRDAMSDLSTRATLATGAKAVLRGSIVLPPGAEGAVAFERIAALLLDAGAEADVMPMLDVRTDDVQCKHAAVTVRPDPDTLFYLQSRGITVEDGKVMLADAFLA